MLPSFRADLHCHTTCSDGSLTPEEIIRLAISTGLSGLSITDHDSIAAYAKAAPLANELGIPLISGVEFSASFEGVGIHLLAYAFPLDSGVILEFCQQHAQRRIARNRAIMEKLDEYGFFIKEEDVYSLVGSSDAQKSWGRPHIAQAMVKKGYVKDAAEAFYKYIGEGKCAYTAGKTFSVQETLEVIHAAKGLAVLAHPMLIEKKRLVKELLRMPLDGIEAYYSRLPLDQQQPWIEIGKNRGWLVTGGSDFHGDAKPHITLGCSWVGEEVFHQLQRHALHVLS